MPVENNPGSWKHGLEPREVRFVEEYLVDLNGTQAIIRSGYRAKTSASASQMAYVYLRKAHIAEAITKAMAEKPGITQTRIIDELALMGFARMGDYITIQPDGTAYVDLSKITQEQTAAISELTSDEYIDGRGEDARSVKRVKIKIADKLSALEKMGKVVGMFKDRHELTGAGGEPLTPDVGTRDLARAVLDILRTAQIKDKEE